MSDMDEYSRYFPVGKKVEVGIPLPNTEVFKDWAIIHEIDEDLVSLQLSRDILPVEVSIHYGQIFELRGGNEDNGYCCRAIVVSEGDARKLLLRLIGEIVSDELREFYRIDAFLPIKYFVSHEQKLNRLHEQWKERRVLRQQLELEKKDQRWTIMLMPESAELPLERHNDLPDTDSTGIVPEDNSAGEETNESWDSIIPLAANISGGGLRIVTHQGFEIGEYALLEILVPSPQRVIDVIGRVVFANRNYAAGSDQEYYNTGVQFVYIDERDRDAIVCYISLIQQKRNRQLREKYLYRGTHDFDNEFEILGFVGTKRKVIRLLSTLLFLFFVVLVTLFFWNYVHEYPKGEIERTFEEGIKKYREQKQIDQN